VWARLADGFSQAGSLGHSGEADRERSDPIRPVLPLQGGAGPEVEESEEIVDWSEDRRVVARKPPRGPSESEKAEHRKTHLPFRPWCLVCIEGRGKDWPHLRMKDETDERGASLSFDYCFMRDVVGGPSVPVLVGKDRGSGAIVAHVVPEKGAGLEWTAKQVCRDLMKLGLSGQIALKGDQEPALVSLIEAVIRLRSENITVPEYSPVGVSQANGRAERGVQTVEGLVRTHKLELEAKLGSKISVESPVFTWLVEHCADLHNKYHVFADGKTSYEIVKGRRY